MCSVQPCSDVPFTLYRVCALLFHLLHSAESSFNVSMFVLPSSAAIVCKHVVVDCRSLIKGGCSDCLVASKTPGSAMVKAIKHISRKNQVRSRQREAAKAAARQSVPVEGAAKNSRCGSSSACGYVLSYCIAAPGVRAQSAALHAVARVCCDLCLRAGNLLIARARENRRAVAEDVRREAPSSVQGCGRMD